MKKIALYLTGQAKYEYYAGGRLKTEGGPWSSDTVTNLYNSAGLRTNLVLLPREIETRLSQPKGRCRELIGRAPEVCAVLSHGARPTGTWTNGFVYDLPREINRNTSPEALLRRSSCNSPDTESARYLMGRAKRLTSVASKAGSFAYTYHASRHLLPIKVSLPNSSYITNDYDSAARLLFTKLNNSSHTTLSKHEYLYNAGNQRIRHTRTDSSYYTNKYDSIGQLVIADSTVSTEDRGYVYDAAWNLNYRTNNTTPTTFTVNNKNELTNVGGSAFSSDGNGSPREMSRDGDMFESDNGAQPLGVLSSSGFLSHGEILTNYVAGGYTFTAAYDAENQLAQIESQYNQRSVFTYDGRGRLRQRQDYLWAGTPYFYWYLEATVRYVYDGMRVIQERNDSNTPTVSYTRGNDLSGSLEGAGGIGGLLSRSSGYSGGNWSTHYFYHADGGGNVTYLVSSSQTLGASYRYDPYGNTLSSSGGLASANVYRFSSKEFMPTGNLYYYGYRFYDANLQRWLNRDPIGEAGELNLYCYVGSNPINTWDILGLLGLKDYDELETSFIFYEARNDANAGWFYGFWNTIRNHSNLMDGRRGIAKSGKFDFKARDLADDGMLNDTFCFEGKSYHSDKFGNFLAGYSAQTWGGGLGNVGVKLGGILYGALDFSRPSYNPFNLDADSRPDINAGIRRAKRRQR